MSGCDMVRGPTVICVYLKTVNCVNAEKLDLPDLLPPRRPLASLANDQNEQI